MKPATVEARTGVRTPGWPDCVSASESSSPFREGDAAAAAAAVVRARWVRGIRPAGTGEVWPDRSGAGADVALGGGDLSRDDVRDARVGGSSVPEPTAAGRARSSIPPPDSPGVVRRGESAGEAGCGAGLVVVELGRDATGFKVRSCARCMGGSGRRRDRARATAGLPRTADGLAAAAAEEGEGSREGRGELTADRLLVGGTRVWERLTVEAVTVGLVVVVLVLFVVWRAVLTRSGEESSASVVSGESRGLADDSIMTTWTDGGSSGPGRPFPLSGAVDLDDERGEGYVCG